MVNKTIARIYWKKIQNGERTFNSIKGEDMKLVVKELAEESLQVGDIDEKQYNDLIKKYSNH